MPVKVVLIKKCINLVEFQQNFTMWLKFAETVIDNFMKIFLFHQKKKVDVLIMVSAALFLALQIRAGQQPITANLHLLAAYIYFSCNDQCDWLIKILIEEQS